MPKLRDPMAHLFKQLKPLLKYPGPAEEYADVKGVVFAPRNFYFPWFDQ